MKLSKPEFMGNLKKFKVRFTPIFMTHDEHFGKLRSAQVRVTSFYTSRGWYQQVQRLRFVGMAEQECSGGSILCSAHGGIDLSRNLCIIYEKNKQRKEKQMKIKQKEDKQTIKPFTFANVRGKDEIRLRANRNPP